MDLKGFVRHPPAEWVIGSTDKAELNACFAHQSYVLLAREAAGIAQRYSAMFERRHVGLCSITDGNLVVLRAALESDRIQFRLTKEVAGRVMDEQRDSVLGAPFHGPPPRYELPQE